MNNVAIINGLYIEDSEARNQIENIKNDVINVKSDIEKLKLKLNTIKISELEGTDDEILQQAITNYEVVIIDKDLSLNSSKEITEEDKCLFITTNNKSKCTFNDCTGFIVSKSNTNISNIYVKGNSSDTLTNMYVGINIKASFVIIDNVQIDSFYDGIAMYEDVLCVFNEIKNSVIGYNLRAGIYIKALSSGQKNTIKLTRNYLNKNGINADDRTSDGETDTGYGLYISGGINIACYSNCYEYNAHVGLYLDRGYSLEGFTDIGGYYEQNKRADVYCNRPDLAKNISFVGTTYNRPLTNVSNAYPRVHLMFNVESLNCLFDEEKNLQLLMPVASLKNLLSGGTIYPFNNIEKVKEMKLNDCCSEKILDEESQKLFVGGYTNYNQAFRMVKNGKYKIRIRFDSSVSNPAFGLTDINNNATVLAVATRTLNEDNVMDYDFVCPIDCKATFFQNGSDIYLADYISIVQVA